jgi:hypothetical protein
VFDPKEVASKGDETIKAARKTYENLENQQAGFKLSVQNLEKSAADEANKKNDERLKSEEDLQAEINKTREESLQASLTAEEKELRQTALKYNELEEKAGNNAALLKQIKEQELIDLQAITDRYFTEELTKQADQEAKRVEAENAAAEKLKEERIRIEGQQLALSEEIRIKGLSANESRKAKELQDLAVEYDAKLLIAKGNATLTAQLITERNAEIERINKEFRDAETAADEKTQSDKLAAFTKTSELVTKSAQDGISTLLSLNDAFAGKSERSQKKAFERNKILQIAQTGVNTYQSAQSAYASQIIPGDPTSVIRGALAAASAVAAGLANIAKIKATTFSSPAPSGGNNSTGGGGGDLASQGVASSEVPQFNPLANLGLENQPGQIQPAYVLASDIASSMEARSKVEDLSRL